MTVVHHIGPEGCKVRVVGHDCMRGDAGRFELRDLFAHGSIHDRTNARAVGDRQGCDDQHALGSIMDQSIRGGTRSNATVDVALLADRRRTEDPGYRTRGRDCAVQRHAALVIQDLEGAVGRIDHCDAQARGPFAAGDRTHHGVEDVFGKSIGRQCQVGDLLAYTGVEFLGLTPQSQDLEEARQIRRQRGLGREGACTRVIRRLGE